MGRFLRNFVLQKFLFSQKILQKSHENFCENEKSIKGQGTSVAVLHLYDSFHQKCSKLGTVTTLGLKNKGWE
jgi:hypothetical protein